MRRPLSGWGWCSRQLTALVLLVGAVAWAAGVSPGLNIDPIRSGGDPPLSTLRDLGVQWVRVEFIDGPNAYSFYDSKVTAYNASGIHVLMILDYASCLTCGAKPSDSSPLADWIPYVNAYNGKFAEILAHFGDRVQAYEIWNEPDQPAEPGYDVYVPPNVYALILSKTCNAARTYAPHATLLVGGLSSGGPDYLRNVTNTIGGMPADAVGIHPYGRRPTDNWPSPSWGFGPLLPFLQTYYPAVTMGRPVWLTEYGTDDTNAQGDFPFHAFTALPQPSFVPVILWFCWSDAMVPPFGLVDGRGSPKPSYASYKKFGNPSLPL